MTPALVGSARGFCGNRMTTSGFKTNWQSFLRRVEKQDKSFERWNFHDLKAKGISEHSAKHGGHRSPGMQRIYDRIPDFVVPPDGFKLHLIGDTSRLEVNSEPPIEPPVSLQGGQS